MLLAGGDVNTHKTDVGGVQLNLADAAAVRQAYRAIQVAVERWEQEREDKGTRGHGGVGEAGSSEQGAGRKITSSSSLSSSSSFLGVTVQPMVKLDGYELIIGSSLDAQFGPVLVFGSGGQLVEVFGDRAIALPPLNTTLARRMMEQTHIYKAFKGVRGRQPIDIAALEQLMVRFSQLVVEQRWIKEIDINPLLARYFPTSSLIALDARIVLHASDVTTDQLRELPTPLLTE